MHCTSEDQPGRIIKVMTFNIRYNTPSDSLNAWPHRKDNAASMVRFYHADIVGIQEGLLGQVQDLAERLPDYGWFGVGRDDGVEAGEFMAVFYQKNRFELLKSSTFWLSENPDIPGKGWDAACSRTVAWGRFKDKKTAEIFYFFNTHFDHAGKTARKESAELLLKNIKKIAGGSEAVVTGDFNAVPSSVPYKILTQNAQQESAVKLIDAKVVSQHPHHGPNGTFTGFKLSNLAVIKEPIDYIFVTKGIKVLNHGTLSDTFDGFFPSDHMPVLAEIIIE